MKGDGTAFFDEAHGIQSVHLGMRDKKKGHRGRRPLHPRHAVYQDGSTLFKFCHDFVGNFRGP